MRAPFSHSEGSLFLIDGCVPPTIKCSSVIGGMGISGLGNKVIMFFVILPTVQQESSLAL